MKTNNLKKTVTLLALGAVPLATVATCDYGPGGGTFFLDQGIDDFFVPSYGFGPGSEVYYEDAYYEDAYYEDVYYEEEYYYEEDEGFFEGFFDWF